ncbi:MAG: Ig-like domain-containing protein, partial [Actinomycetota bacterium]|nr:Ig-like domain-containing protein [Actinomycetota bacterium]
YTYTPDPGFVGTDTFTYTASDGTGRSDTALVTILVARHEATLVKDITPGGHWSSPSRFTSFGDSVYFLTSPSSGSPTTGLWKSDGTTAGTVMVKGFTATGPPSVTVSGDAMYFVATDGTSGSELWRSDGTAAGTVLVKDINAGSGSSSPDHFKVIGSTLFFSASDGVNRGLWKSDGTAAGTVLVSAVGPINNNIASIGSTLFFSGSDGVHGAELWKSDGTAAGTVMVKDINSKRNPSTPGTQPSYPGGLTAFGTTVLFRATTPDTESGVELWKSDGTEAGTVIVANINATADSFPTGFRVFGNMVLFRARDSVVGIGLWRTDGTEAGTVPVTYKVTPDQLTVVNDVVYFSASTAARGNELWKTDGTPAGTVLADDIAPGADSSSPSSLTPAFGTMFFSAFDRAHGRELWRLAVDTPALDAVEDAYSTGENTALTVPAPGVLANDTDADGNLLTAGSASDPANGSVRLNADGSFTYTPDTNFAGTDTFTYSASDPDGNTDTATVTITVAEGNDFPVAGDDFYRDDTPATPLTVPAPGVLANDTDADGDTLTAGSASDPPGGSVTLNPDGSFTYVADPLFSGRDSFTYTAREPSGGSDSATVTITVGAVNDAPVAADDAYTTAEDSPLTMAAPGVMANDADPNGDPVSAASPTTPANGTVVLNTNGSFTYTPDADFAGTDSFTYTVSDDRGGTDTATVTITVAGVNDAPACSGTALATAEDTAESTASGCSDIDGDALTYSIVAQPAHGTASVGADANLHYTPSANYNGPDSFTYKANDGTVDSAPAATVSVTVNAVNDAPTCAAASLTTNEDTAGTTNPACSDIDGDALSYA